MGSGILPALPSAGTAAIELFAIGGMTIAHQSIALTVRAVNGDGDHERLLFFENGLTFRAYHILLICATTQRFVDKIVHTPYPPLAVKMFGGLLLLQVESHLSLKLRLLLENELHLFFPDLFDQYSSV